MGDDKREERNENVGREGKGKRRNRINYVMKQKQEI